MTVIISLVLFIGGLGSGIAFPILPALGEKLGIASFMIGIILSSDKIARLIFNIPAGQLFPRLGIRRMLGGAMAGATAGLLFFSFAVLSSAPALWLLVGRVLYGIGASFLIVGAQSAVLELSSDHDRGRKMASVRLAVNAAIPGGLVLGGLISDLHSDFAAFIAGAGISLIGTIVAFIFLPGKQSAEHKNMQSVDIRRGPTGGFRFPSTKGFLPALILNFLIFLTVQGSLQSTLVLFLQRQQAFLGGLTAQGSSGLVMAVMVSCAALSAFFAGRILDRLSRRSVLIFPALIIMSIGFFILSRATSITFVLIAIILIGLTYNNLTIPLTAIIGDRVIREEQSRSIGILQFFGDLGGTIGPLFGIMVAAWIGEGNLYLIICFLCLASLPAVFSLYRVESER